MRAHDRAAQSDEGHTRVPLGRLRQSTAVGEVGAEDAHTRVPARRLRPSRVPVRRPRPSTLVGLVGAEDPVHEAGALGSQGGAPPSQAAVQVLVPNVLDVLNQFGVPLRELEMQMLYPQGVIMGIVYGQSIPALSGMNLAQVYEWLTENFTSACGDTANLLRETTFPDSGAERRPRNLTQVVAELRRPEDANIRINSNGHAFFVERRGGNCRILQSYIGRYALADSAGGTPHASATTMPAAQLADRLQAIGDHHLANRRESRFTTPADEEALFGGPLFATSDIRDDGVNLQGEVVTHVRPEDEQYGHVRAQLDRFASTWDEIRTSTLTPEAWLATRSN